MQYLLRPNDERNHMSELRPRIDQESRDQQVATDHSTPPQVLDEVARKPVVHWEDGQRTVSDRVRQQVAEHPEVLPDTLSWLLSVSVDEAVICNALRHESTPASELRRFIHSTVPTHWTALVQNTGVGDAFIYEVVTAHADRPQVALCALMNPAIRDSTFERIAGQLGPDWSDVVAGIRKACTGRW
jgi:hypothetical protein